MEIFLHKTAKFHVKIITRSKVMKVYTKSLKNAEQHDKVIPGSLNACIKFKLPFNYSYVINPLTTAHFVMKMSTH